MAKQPLINLANKDDIDKLCIFFDNPCTVYPAYGILYEVSPGEVSPYVRAGDYSRWQYARRLTKEEIKELC